MKKGIVILLLVLFSFWDNLFSQQLSHQVLVPVAGVATGGNLNYSQTIGETVVEIVSGSNYVFTQGFQQPGIKFSEEKAPQGNGVKVYPNPAKDFIKIELFGEVGRSFLIELMNITGTIIRSERLVFPAKYWNVEEIPLHEILNGIYFIRITSEDRLINRTFKIEKL